MGFESKGVLQFFVDILWIQCARILRAASNDKNLFHPGGHVKIHAAPNQMYDCPLCGVEFEHISSLKDHVPSHKVRTHSARNYWMLTMFLRSSVGSPPRIELKRRLYGIYLVRFLSFRFPCRPKLTYFCAYSFSEPSKQIN